MGGFIDKIPKTVLLLLIFVASILAGMSQSPHRITKVFIENADSITIMENSPDVYILRGDVVFRHDSTFLYSDSAYLYNSANSLEAFSNVRIEQGDTLFIYGDYLNYEGNQDMAKMQNNVRMESRGATLFTDHLNYDRRQNVAYYFDGGMIVDSLNELTSIYGQYSPDTKKAFFQEKVRLVNEQMELNTDTLEYSTDTKIALILSPTVIESDSGFIYSRSGWYNTVSEESMLYDRSLVITKDKSKTMTADSMYYNKSLGFVEAYNHMVLNDTVQKTILTGNYGYYDEQIAYAFATDSAQFVEYSKGDSLYIHADTLKMETIDEERLLMAYYGVRIYGKDLQGVCDSLRFHTVDSILRLYKNPILWNTGYQLTGDTINILFNDSTVERLDVLNYAFAIQERDSILRCYDQLKGKNLTAYFVSGELDKIHVEGSAEAIYYPIDDKNATFTTLYKTKSSYMTISIEERKPFQMLIYPEPDISAIPLPDLNPDEKFLQGFVNYNYLRPRNKDDIFTKMNMKTEDMPPPRRTRHTHRH